MMLVWQTWLLYMNIGHTWRCLLIACGLHVHSCIRKPLYINTGHTWRCLLMACVLHACALKQLALFGKPIYKHWPHMEVFASWPKCWCWSAPHTMEVFASGHCMQILVLVCPPYMHLHDSTTSWQSGSNQSIAPSLVCTALNRWCWLSRSLPWRKSYAWGSPCM